MKFRNSIVAFLVLCIAIATLYFVQKNKEKKAVSEEQKSKIVKSKIENISMIHLKNKSSDVTFKRIWPEDDSIKKSWVIEKPVKAGIDETLFKRLLDDLRNLKEKRSFDIKKTELGDFGLGSPLLALDFTLKKGAPFKMYFGDKNPGETMQYIRLGESLKVSLVDSTLFDFGEKELKDLRKKNLFDFNNDKIQKVTADYLGFNETLILDRKDSEFYISEPLKTKADKGAVNRFLTSLAGIKAQDFPSEDFSQSPSKWGFNKPYAVITVKLDDNKEEKLIIGKDDKDKKFYARRAADKFVIAANESVKKDLTPKLSNLVNKKLSEWQNTDIAKIDIKFGNQTAEVEKSQDIWVLKKLQDLADQGKVNNILQRFRSLNATEFVSVKPAKSHGLANPHLTALFYGADGNVLAKYLFGKYIPTNKMYLMAGSRFVLFDLGSGISPRCINADVYNEVTNV